MDAHLKNNVMMQKNLKKYYLKIKVGPRSIHLPREGSNIWYIVLRLEITLTLFIILLLKFGTKMTTFIDSLVASLSLQKRTTYVAVRTAHIQNTLKKNAALSERCELFGFFFSAQRAFVQRSSFDHNWNGVFLCAVLPIALHMVYSLSICIIYVQCNLYVNRAPLIASFWENDYIVEYPYSESI
jgi:hypothetical protein